jgi:UDP-N-acetylglucosamine:LPS N-acetylglucosamine transferase
MSKPKKILAISSPGGHWIQLNKLCDGLQQRQTHHIIYAVPAGLFKAKVNKKLYDIIDVSADNKWKLLPCALQIFYILLKERPDTIISTGAAPGVLAILLGKLLRINTIWVDSIANVKQLSRSGRMIKKHATVFITQWQPLEDEIAQYRGAIL